MALPSLTNHTSTNIILYGYLVECVLGASVLLLLFGSLCYCLLVARRSKGKTSASELSPTSSSCRVFTFQEVQHATSNFEECFLLGSGGFGKVYKGKLENGAEVAVKRANPESKQGLTEFQNEIRLLSKLQHPHIVSLIGYCHEGDEMVIVYEYMGNGSLSKWLYEPNETPLSWKQRLEICIGAARGLHHLHTATVEGIIHRDVKSSNILLDGNFVAKVADFGISEKGPSSLDESHVVISVKGTFGYIDPEYFRSSLLTEKSDVYSFGVVLIEVISGRPALDHSLPTEKISLASWALDSELNGELHHEMIDPNLVGKVSVSSLEKVWGVAKRCLAENGIKRPPMGFVLCCLEDALHLQLSNVKNEKTSFLDYDLQHNAEWSLNQITVSV
ncbi:receptor-like protein kinase THESEUS 1 [Vigna unguiculata]|uniref:Interleukin-1 receptor-associated kinase 4 n=1 Tax=Vigna unguiculata TaxID=3917 RepID=A0A4D6N7Y6_VIGUN|nr:receptor-like protein kinase THESEUS 1 [Vigna unguiculata]QCE09876.1 interleukin-1 receptor-associated kinase 4 [Vigna unguiculata]